MNYDRMPRVAFFTYTEWAFGSIHKALCKELYKCGIQADIIDWNRQYSRDEFKFLLDTYDTFVTTPSNAPQILHTYGVPWGKMILIAHGREDIQMCAQEYIIPYNFLKGYGVIAKNLVETIRGYNIDCDVKVLQNGVSFDTFYRRPSDSLNVIGYGSKIHRCNNYDNVNDWKRGHLVQQVSALTSTPIANKGEMSHLAMPGYYGTIDCLMLSSTINESCGLPLLEAAAAGRVPLSTMVGINLDVPETTGYILPMDDMEYVKQGTMIINELKENPVLYRRKCLEAQEFAREYYDWSKVIEPWINLLLS